ncbi:MAG: hypothetical protein ACOY42_09875 [Pseudomonadota bacterium]
MKKFSIHLDAVLVIALLAAAVIAFVLFQHREQQRLFRQNIDLAWELQNRDTRVRQLEQRLARCRDATATRPE